MQQEQTNATKWIAGGALFLLATAIGHLFFVDISLRYFLGSYVTTQPVDVLSEMSAASIDWGVFGSNNLFHIFTGLSIWLSISTAALALWSVADRTMPSRRFTASLVCSIAAGSFTVIAYICFILPPFLGGLGATICYARGCYLDYRDR